MPDDQQISTFGSMLCIRVVCDSDSPVPMGTRFDWSKGCPRCACGSPVVGKFHLKPSALPKAAPVARTDCGELLVRDTVRSELIKRFGASAKDFVPVTDRTGTKILPWYLLWPRAVLPAMNAKKTKLQTAKEYQCEVCGRPGWFNGFIAKYVYDKSIWPTEPLACLSRTWEHFGVWASGVKLGRRNDTFMDWTKTVRDVGPSTPLVVMRPDAAAWLKEVAKRYVEFTPIVLD